MVAAQGVQPQSETFAVVNTDEVQPSDSGLCLLSLESVIAPAKRKRPARAAVGSKLKKTKKDMGERDLPEEPSTSQKDSGAKRAKKGSEEQEAVSTSGDGGDGAVQGGMVALGTVEQRIGVLGELSLAPDIRAKYRACYNRFTSVTHSLGAGEDHFPARRVQHFVLWAKDKAKSHARVSRQLAARAHFAKLRGDGDPTAGFPLRAALKGWARQEGKTPDQRAPIELEMRKGLVGALTVICNTQYEELLFPATFSLAFFGVFRTSELVAKAKSDTSDRALRWGDLKMGQDIAELKVRHSKSDQKGKGTVVRLRRLGDPKCCPIELLMSYTACRPRQTRILTDSPRWPDSHTVSIQKGPEVGPRKGGIPRERMVNTFL
ncbi:hypothetical protein NDU88_005996 [Pleurodeles waltl]|uniref:Uncharacterized protein n=1 Tax=Pleurodeles waltl TaxID=8319 RepID=A0AAV7TE94_PLEWA|nr:hypothetical protein NDU88_005996 [Pleurodeles waltl]